MGRDGGEVFSSASIGRNLSGTVGTMGTFVVGIDGSDESVGALRWALTLAGSDHQVRAVVVWAYPIEVAGGFGYGAAMATVIPYDEIQAGAQATLDHALSQVDARGADLSGETIVAASPTAGLVEAAQDADVLIVGTRHHSTLDRVFVGSVANQCAHHAPCPFVAVPASAPPIGDVIAVAIDGSDSAAAALRWASTIATGLDVGLRVIAVWEQVGWPGGPRLADPPRSDDELALDELRAKVEEIAPDAVDRAELRPVHADRHVADHLLEVADGAGMLVMGSRGRGGFAGLLLGSVSQRCLEGSEIPVAIIRE